VIQREGTFQSNGEDILGQTTQTNRFATYYGKPPQPFQVVQNQQRTSSTNMMASLMG